MTRWKAAIRAHQIDARGLRQRVELIGAGPIKFAQDAAGLTLTLPDKAPNEYAYAFVIRT